MYGNPATARNWDQGDGLDSRTYSLDRKSPEEYRVAGETETDKTPGPPRRWFWPTARYLGLLAAIGGFGVQKYRDDVKARGQAMGRHCETVEWQERMGDQIKAIRVRLDSL